MTMFPIPATLVEIAGLALLAGAVLAPLAYLLVAGLHLREWWHLRRDRKPCGCALATALAYAVLALAALGH